MRVALHYAICQHTGSNLLQGYVVHRSVDDVPGASFVMPALWMVYSATAGTNHYAPLAWLGCRVSTMAAPAGVPMRPLTTPLHVTCCHCCLQVRPPWLRRPGLHSMHRHKRLHQGQVPRPGMSQPAGLLGAIHSTVMHTYLPTRAQQHGRKATGCSPQAEGCRDCPGLCVVLTEGGVRPVACRWAGSLNTPSLRTMP